MKKLITPGQMQDERYLAHTKHINGVKLTETLLAHARLTLYYYERYCAVKGIGKIVEELIAVYGFQGEEAERVYLLFVYAIYLHDFGKINPRYQYDVLKNSAFRGMRGEARK
ncbi:MAG TPA: CRISPR-associated helicase/endonuclease Cas3, partial [Pelotomaculum sp.]|nr:CRISPR-associated helicase/endonuclease Cas3 [Pelotomaculum sp.]